MDKIKTVAIYANQKRDEGGKFTSLIARAAMLRGINVRLLARQVGDVSGADLCGSEDELLDGADALITLGGDGTVLEMCSHAASHGVPMLGINLGHLGFLTGLERDGADRVSELFDGNFSVEERMMLDVSVSDKIYTALNEVTFYSSESSKIASFDLHCDGVRVIKVKADGLIVSTPTGSTAYSLSAGGPIIDPSTELFCVTPVCPHTLGSRPLVVSTAAPLGVSGSTDGALRGMNVTIDGKARFYVPEHSTIEVRRSSLVTRIIRLGDTKFFDIVNSKLYNR